MSPTRSKALAFFIVAYNLIEGGVAMFGAALSGMVMVGRFWMVDPASLRTRSLIEPVVRRMCHCLIDTWETAAREVGG